MSWRAARLCFAVLVGCAAAKPRPPNEIDRLVVETLTSTPLAGVSVAVARHGEIVFAKGYGELDREHRVLATATTRYHIGSLTKQFTAAAIMQLVEAGKLQLDEPIARFVPDYPALGAISIRQLLTHTSGIYDFVDDAFDRTKHWQHSELIAIAASHPLAFAPGSAWAYSNSNYLLLGTIIEQVSGQSFDNYVREHELAPLGLGATDTCESTRESATGYEAGLTPAKAIDPSWPFAAGGLCSTVGDLARWTSALRGGRVVRADSYRAMTTPVALQHGTYPYGFGLVLDELLGHPTVGHGGGMVGFASVLLDVPGDEVTVVVLTNTRDERHPEARLARRIAASALGLLPRDVPLPADARARYAGRYRLPNGVEIEYAVDGNRFTGGPVGGPRNVLLYQGGDTFRDDELAGREIHFDVAGGAATAVDVHQPRLPVVHAVRIDAR